MSSASPSSSSSSSVISDSEADSALEHDDIELFEDELVSEHSDTDNYSNPPNLLGGSPSFDSEADAFEDELVSEHSDNYHNPPNLLGGSPPFDFQASAVEDELVSEHSDNSSNPSDLLGPRSPSFDSEVDAFEVLYPAPEEISDSDDNTSTHSDSISSRESSADRLFEHPDLYSRDSDPLSPDLEGELELALLAQMDEQLRQPPRRPGNREGNMAPPRQGGGVNGNGPDVLVDLELYFRQERPQRRAQNQQGPADVIDLTNEPDSPVQSHAPRPIANPRRQNPQGRNPPSFARSDSSILAGNPPVIDLTDDSPEVPRRLRPERPALHHPPMPPPYRNRERREPSGFMLRNTASAFSGLAAGLRRHLYPLHLFPPEEDAQLLDILHTRIQPGDLNNPLGNIQLQYENGAFDRPDSPKPVHQPPPPARSGYTRDTGSDLVVVCPACNEELAYDPDVPTNESQPTRKGKRQRSENHFWALKACGHVYCEDCFENRKPVAKRPNKGLPMTDGKLECAVNGCGSAAASKTSWVGIYL